MRLNAGYDITQRPEPRYDHCAVTSGAQMLVFGGTGAIDITVVGVGGATAEATARPVPPGEPGAAKGLELKPQHWRCNRGEPQRF